MKITLYTFPNCIHAKAIKLFLQNNFLPYEEIVLNNNEKKQELIKTKQGLQTDISVLKINYNSSIQLITGFNEILLNQLLEHINIVKDINLSLSIQRQTGEKLKSLNINIIQKYK